MKKISSPWNNHGFTILEILLGMAVFMIGMLGVALLHISSMKSDDFSGRLTEATRLATTKLEELSGLKLSHARWVDTDGDGDSAVQDPDRNGIDEVGGGNFGLDDTSAGSFDHFEDIQLGNRTYRVTWNVAVNTPVINSNTVRVYVQWSVKGIPQNIQMTRIQSKDA